MPKLSPSVLLIVAALTALPLLAQTSDSKSSSAPKKEAPKRLANSSGGTTPHETFSVPIGGSRRTGSSITITYGRPYTKHPRTGEMRKIWGGLVPWDKADRLGADEATLFINQHPIEIGGTTLPAGAYTLYIVPSETGTSKLAFSKNIGKWGVPVDEKSDVARVDLKKETMAAPVDQLTLAVENVPAGSQNGVLKIMWENTQFSVPFAVRKA